MVRTAGHKGADYDIGCVETTHVNTLRVTGGRREIRAARPRAR